MFFNVISAPSSINAPTFRSNSLTVTDAPTAAPDEEVEPLPEPLLAEVVAFYCASAPVNIILDIPSFKSFLVSFNIKRPVSSSIPEKAFI